MTNEDAIHIMNAIIYMLEPQYDKERVEEAVEMAIKALEQKVVLGKIKSDILDEAEYAYADFDQYKEDILHAEPDELPDDDFRYGMERAVEIIDKYRKGGVE